MFVLVATALAANAIGWPCQRLNWGWRNVWSTCSINQGIPINGGSENAALIPNHYRTTHSPVIQQALDSAGTYQPGYSTAVPSNLCTNAANTGSGLTANLRNRCRRAIDAYSMLVATCKLAPHQTTRGPGPGVSPDYLPSNGHHPHIANVVGLTANARMCLLPTGLNTPNQLGTPSTVCPGLLGWFTVVFNACGFTNVAAIATPLTQPGEVPNFIKTNFEASPNVVGAANTVMTGTWAGTFCSTGAISSSSWNVKGGTGITAFKTSRCRKALDQFGRTATRCHNSNSGLSGPMQAGGYSDPLKAFAIGNGVANGAAATPAGANLWAPLCNV